MRYGSTTKATHFEADTPGHKVARGVLSLIIPVASPDHEKLYPLVRRWALEVTDAGVPNREVALAESGVVLFRAPEGRNIGMWTDSPMVFAEGELDPISAEEFEALWAKAEVGDA